jgi:chromosome segregation ATPase
MSDPSIEEINKLLESRQNKIGTMEATTKASREKLKQINLVLQNQENELMKILTLINQDEIILTEIDPDIGSTIEDVYPKIEEVQSNLRKSRNSLANLIRKG